MESKWKDRRFDCRTYFVHHVELSTLDRKTGRGSATVTVEFVMFC